MKEKRKRNLLCLITILILLSLNIFSEQLISPSNQNINYYGRIDFTDPEAPKYCWSGVIIEAAFTGSTIGMKIDHNNAYYDIEVDDTFDTLIHVTSSGNHIFTTNLSGGNHIVRIKLRSEDHYTAATFNGLLIAEGSNVLSASSKPSRKIEFIGDSYTAGYGIESSGRDCSSELLKKYTNANTTFAGIVTKAFHAQSIILGWSGAGVVRNYGESTKRSNEPFPTHYDRTLGIVTGNSVWDYSTWKPELVVICLGTNDYSTSPHPDDSMYIGDYHKFIKRILNNYPDVSILCVSTGDATFEKNVKTVVSEQNTIYNNPKVYSAEYPSTLELTGCDWHPNKQDNIKVADVLIKTIMEKLVWDTAATTACKTVAYNNRIKNSEFSVIHFSNSISLIPLNPINQIISYSLLSPNGKIIMKKCSDITGRCTLNTLIVSNGVYVIGNYLMGWKAIAVK